jgi:serine/threonine protein kinase
LIHRDLKPANILMRKEPGITGEVMKLADFGLSRSLPQNDVAEETNTQRGEYLGEYLNPLSMSVGNNERSLTMGIGTPTYTSPELCKTHSGLSKYTAMADIFSLGVILCEMFHPFETGMERARVLTQLRNEIVPRCLESEFPAEAVLLKAMISHDPLKRPPADKILSDSVFSFFDNNMSRTPGRDLTRRPSEQLQELTLLVFARTCQNLPERILAVISEWAVECNIPKRAVPSGWQSDVDKGGDIMILRYRLGDGVNLQTTNQLKTTVEGRFKSEGVTKVVLDISIIDKGQQPSKW